MVNIKNKIMTQEEKAKAYDEAIERAREKSNDEHITSPFLKSLLEDIFPELKESKDEKIKNTLINLVKRNGTAYYINQIHKDDIFAWLENQGKKVDTIENFDTEFEKQVSRLLASIINKDWEYTEGFVKWASNSLLGYAKHEIEKESEQKQSNKPQGKSALEAVKEEKVDNANKIKPKFKVGDWIVCCDYEPLQIIGITKNDYYGMSNGDGRPIHMVDNNPNIRLWSIDDAKDGDVLAIGSEYFLFKNKKDNTSPVVCISHCFCDSAGAFRVTNGRDYGEFLSIENGIKVCPATKEQRDLLEKAMTDAGYTFDFNEKELRRK